MSHAHTKNITLRMAIAAGMAVLALLGSPARADAPTDAPSANAGDTLQEVVVTVNRRTENSQQVPIAISHSALSRGCCKEGAHGAPGYTPGS